LKGKMWHLAAVGVTVLVLLAATAGCSLADLTGSGPAPAAPSSTPGGPTGVVSLVGEEVYHVFQPGEHQAGFTAVPATGSAVSYLDGTGQVGPLDTVSTDPTIRSLNIVFNGAGPGDVVNVTLFTYQGTAVKTIQVTTTGSIDVAAYDATSCLLTADAAATTGSAQASYAYLYQMTNSAGDIFTYTVPEPAS